MVDGERESTEPSLELPKLGWRRKKKAAPAEPVPEAVPEPRAAPPAPPAPPARPARPARPAPAPAPELEDTRASYVDEVETVTRPTPVAVDTPPRQIKLRRPGGMLMAVIVGIVVGLGMVGLTWASLQTCETLQGTSSCGKTGYPMLIVILVIAVVLGGLLLRVARVPEPGSTSFLAVGLASVVALLLFVNSLTDPVMVAIIPVVCALTFALAHWVTRTFIEPATR